MKSRWIYCWVVLLVVQLGCTNRFGKEVDCSDDCVGLCPDEQGFEFASYEPSCGGGEEVDFCGIASAGASCVEPDFEVEEVRVSEIHRALLAGEISCEWLIRRYIDRVLWHDLAMEGSAPPMNAFVTLNEGAIEAARRLDDYQRCEGELAGPLHCAPFVIKANYASRDVPLTVGSRALLEAQPVEDAYTVRRLRRSGAIMLGSTTMDEFARGAEGVSGRSGKTGNAYDTRYLSGGSSSGAAVAVAANFALGGLGTDNCASLTLPAAYNGLATIRPSYGLVSTEGIFPSNHVDVVAGPMTRSVEDLARFFDVMSDFNPHDWNHCEETIVREESYQVALELEGLRGKRIGVLRRISQEGFDLFQGASDEVEAHYEEFFEELRGLGAEVVEDVELSKLSQERKSSGMGREVERFLEGTRGGASSVEEICESELFSRFVYEDRKACERGMEQWDMVLNSRYKKGMGEYQLNRAYVEGKLAELELDALVYPVDIRGRAGTVGVGANCILASVTGLPTLVVPTGATSAGLPIGMSFTGRLYEESTLFEIGYAYEQATMHRRPPQLEKREGEPPLDIEEFNEVHREMGRVAFEEVLREGEKYELTQSVFADIARRVLEENGLEELLR